jgi:Transglycosylase SLT domain
MLAIAICESHLNQKAYNPNDPHGGSYGIFQINGAWLNTSKSMGLDIINNVQDNFQFARVVLNHGGVSNWGCHRIVSKV